MKAAQQAADAEFDTVTTAMANGSLLQHAKRKQSLPLENWLTLKELCSPEEWDGIMNGHFCPSVSFLLPDHWRMLKKEATPEQWNAIMKGAPVPPEICPLPIWVMKLIEGLDWMSGIPNGLRARVLKKHRHRLPANVQDIVEPTPKPSKSALPFWLQNLVDSWDDVTGRLRGLKDKDRSRLLALCDQRVPAAVRALLGPPADMPPRKAISGKPVPDDGPRPGESLVEVEMPHELTVRLSREAARRYQCSSERLAGAMMAAMADTGALHLTFEEEAFDHGRKFERTLLERLNGSPVDLREARPVAKACGIDANDLLRGGLARMLSEYRREGAIRFGSEVCVTFAHRDKLRELAGLLEITPEGLLEHTLEMWLADMYSPDIGLLEGWADIIKNSPARRKRILASIAKWQAARKDGGK
jgi:hypothetical protein